eukprot:GHVU01096180.1.p1 GENE.GHVU01096180.1~~GHVU01096180.1.p1  ORF type:complete len:242 (+),score=41.21 GHVU01096180.1:94-819(+)
MATKEYKESTVSETPPASTTATVRVPLAELVAICKMVEGLVVSKTAEALRRRAAEHLTLGIAVRGAVMDGVAADEGCACREIVKTTLSTVTPLPKQADSPELYAATLQIMDMMNVAGAVDLHDYPLARYNYTDQEDREEVDKAKAEGKQNPSARQVLVLCAGLAPHQTADRKIREACPSLAVPSSSSRAPPPKAVPARRPPTTAVPMDTSTPDDREAARKKTASAEDVVAESSAVEADEAL